MTKTNSPENELLQMVESDGGIQMTYAEYQVLKRKFLDNEEEQGPTTE